MMKAVQLTIKGKVQGVGFRYYTQRKAEELNISGFVQNKPDASVFIEAEGKDKDVDTFVDWCAIGPQWARVLEIKKSEIPFVGFQKFNIR